jgi:membrane protein YdbS with pleckstrin-like domain
MKKFTVSEFAYKIRNKYPNSYDDLQDKELVKLWIRKYPADIEFISDEKENSPILLKNNSSTKTIKPSQFTNLFWYLLTIISSIVFLPLIIPTLIISIYKFYEIDCWSYNFTKRTIEEKKGIFSTSIVEIQYFRIKSVMVEEPFWMRLFGLSNIHILSTEKFKPRMTIYAVNDGGPIKEFISEITHNNRIEMNVRDFDINIS